jgi:hypothetical protein
VHERALPSEGLRQCEQTGVLIDNEKQCKWVYYICDEHFGSLLDSDLRFIARNHGKKSL